MILSTIKSKGSTLKATGIFMWNDIYSKVTTGVDQPLVSALRGGCLRNRICGDFPLFQGLYNWADVKTTGDFFSFPVDACVWWLLRHVVSVWRDSQCKLWASH